MVKQEIKNVCETREKILFFAASFAMALSILFTPGNVFAENAGASAVKTSMGNFYDIMAALVSSIASIFVLWGFFELGTALQSQNGTEQSQAFKRIAGGLLMTIGPAIVTGLLG